MVNKNDLVLSFCGTKRAAGFLSAPKLFLFVFQTMLSFFYIYEFNLRTWGLPTFITSRRIVVVVLLFCFLFALLKNRSSILYVSKQAHELKAFIGLMLALLLYCLLLFFLIGEGEGDSGLVTIIQLIFFSLLPVFFVPAVFQDRDSFFRAILASAILQTIIILLCQTNSTFCSFIDINFSDNYEYVIRNRVNYAGGLGCITAPGLLRYSTGMVACLYFFFKKKSIHLFLLFLVFSFFGTMVARTGLFVAIVGLLIILFFLYKSGGKKVRRAFLITMLFLAVFLPLIIRIPTINSYLGNYFARLIQLFENGFDSEFLDGYLGRSSDNVLPPINSKTFFGTGMLDGLSGNNVYCKVDGGFIKTFFAFGFAGSIVFYLVAFGILIKRIVQIKGDKAMKYTLLFFVFYLAIGEFKEFFILSQYALFIMFSCFYLKTRKVCD